MKKIKISIITSTRADFGIFSNLIKLIKEDDKFELKIIVTGSHLSKRYGSTIKEIKKNKIRISEKVNILSTDESKLGILKSSSNAIFKLGQALNRLNPDIILILGDRHEILNAAQAGVILEKPIVHFHGGELTLNSYDNYFRHAISKLSNIHFVSTNVYRKRLINMGENPKNVFNVGSIGLEKINDMKLYKKYEIEKIFKIKLLKNIVLFTLHPETLNLKDLKNQINISINALKHLKNTSVIITIPNHDVGSYKIISILKKFCKKKKNFYLFHSLGRKMYFSCINNANLIVGNSSSGVIEAPSFKKYSINLGERQKGREMCESVISVNFNENKIKKALKNYLHKKFSSNFKNPYFKKDSAKLVLKILKKVNFKKIRLKTFYESKK